MALVMIRKDGWKAAVQLMQEAHPADWIKLIQASAPIRVNEAVFKSWRAAAETPGENNGVW